ncbi:MAG: metal ABC transporter substrate-binding protein [Acidobacteriota bacterium]|jgi:zinc transport system substrate-binding protein
MRPLSGSSSHLVSSSAIFLLLAAAACGGTSPGEGTQPGAGTSAGDAALSVYTVNYPLAYFTGRIGADEVDVVLPVALTEGDPAYAEPGAEVIAEMQGADLIVRNGAGYAQWFAMATLPTDKVVDTSAAFADRVIVEEGATTHSHGPEGEHTHSATAFTTWLDPQLAIAQAEAIETALATRRPAAAASFDANLTALRADLLDLDESFAAAAAAIGDAPLLASHPVYQYFARRYDLDLESVHFEPGIMPDESQWQGLAELHASHPARWMIWEAQPAADIAARLEAMGIGVVVIDPCATPPAAGDYLSVMRDNAAHLASAAAR